jgi:hypothetical protein
MSEQLPLSFDRSQFRPDFAEWLLANGHIWSAFAARADAVWNRGRRHYSARTIIEVLRFESMLAEVGGEWKINNNYAPDLARLYRQTYPDRAALFETRVLSKSLRAA